MKAYKNKRIFITGHTGFKGSWITQVLLESGADVKGYALEPPTSPSLFGLLSLDKHCESVVGDIRDLHNLESCLAAYKPEIVIHMAAQPLVIPSYADPVYTYETNVMGTVNLLEAARKCDSIRSVLNVTTDKVYKNLEWCYGYRETDALNGYDPYSNSKSCSELVSDCYRNSFFSKSTASLSTVRAGNVIGGGDFSNNRIVPDCYRATIKEESVLLRNPYSVRPYQHVLEPIFLYLHIANKQIGDKSVEGSYNIGPDDADCVTTLRVAELYKKHCNKLKICIGNSINLHESTLLKLDCSKARSTFGWKPIWNIEKAIEKCVALYDAVSAKTNIVDTVIKQIHEYDTVFEGEIS